jgi:predicted RNase H-like HicB family nuclease
VSKSIAKEHNVIRGDIMHPVYIVIIHPAEEGGYWAKCDMPNGGCTTQGDTIQETQENMFESIALFLEDYPDITNYFLTFELRDA